VQPAPLPPNGDAGRVVAHDQGCGIAVAADLVHQPALEPEQCVEAQPPEQVRLERRSVFQEIEAVRHHLPRAARMESRSHPPSLACVPPATQSSPGSAAVLAAPAGPAGETPALPGGGSRVFRSLLIGPSGLAVLVTLANAVKPVLIDDTAYLTYARHIAQHPLDPYGFDIYWYSGHASALTVPCPPLAPL